MFCGKTLQNGWLRAEDTNHVKHIPFQSYFENVYRSVKKSFVEFAEQLPLQPQVSLMGGLFILKHMLYRLLSITQQNLEFVNISHH